MTEVTDTDATYGGTISEVDPDTGAITVTHLTNSDRETTRFIPGITTHALDIPDGTGRVVIRVSWVRKDGMYEPSKLQWAVERSATGPDSSPA